MFSERNILYFKDYDFEDGKSKSKPKYFLILRSKEKGFLLISLPSSVMHLPTDTVHSHGCLEIPSKGIGCYIIRNDVAITECGFIFPEMTYIYAEWIKDTTVEKIENNYASNQYKLIGKLTQEEHRNIVTCIKRSSNLKRKYKEYL